MSSSPTIQADRKSKPYVLSPAPLNNHPPQTPLEYLLEVLNDSSASPDRRLRAAIAAAAYVHPRPAPASKPEPTQTTSGGGWHGL